MKSQVTVPKTNFGAETAGLPSLPGSLCDLPGTPTRHTDLCGPVFLPSPGQPPPLNSQECKHSTMVVASMKYPPQRAHMR